MIYQVSKLLRDVRVCLDRNMSSTALAELGDVDTLSQDELIESKLLESVERVHLSAPIHLLESGHNFGDALYWRDLESGWVLLPDDFMRLVVFEMDDWERAVYAALRADSPEAVVQHSRYKGLRGTSEHPVCVLDVRAEGKVLEFYSCKSQSAQVRRGVYLPYPVIDANGGIDISERCYQSVVYTAAGLVLLTVGETEAGEASLQTAQTLLQQ